MDKFRTALLDLTVTEGGTVFMLALSQALVNKKEQEMAEGREALLQNLVSEVKD